MGFSRFTFTSSKRATSARNALWAAGFPARTTDVAGATLLDVFHTEERQQEAEHLIRSVDPRATPVRPRGWPTASSADDCAQH